MSLYRESEGVQRSVRAHEKQLADQALREVVSSWILVVMLCGVYFALALLAWGLAITQR